eukprot:jgi/Mesen1/4792/ME000243S03969
MTETDNDEHDGQYVVALIENRAKEVGMAAFDCRTASLHLTQYIESSRSYQNTTTLLQFYSPSEIIVSANTLAAPEGIVGAASLADSPLFCNAKKVVLNRGCFDDTKASLHILSYPVHAPFCNLSPPMKNGIYERAYYMLQGGILVQTLAAKDTSKLRLDSYNKQYYLCLGAAAAVLKW